MSQWEIQTRRGAVENVSDAELRERCLSGSVTPETPTRREGDTTWGWAIDVSGLSHVFGAPRVHKLIPAVLLPLAVFLVVFGVLLEDTPTGRHPKGGPETVAALIALGGFSAVTGVVIPVLEFVRRRIAIARMRRDR